MAHVNWRERPLSLKAVPHEKYKTQLELTLTAAQAAELRAQLAELFETPSSAAGVELRLDLPQGWTIYWKPREQGLSRLQLAKPQVDQWVASVQLAADHGRAFLAALEALGASGPMMAPVSLAALGPVTHIVNFELVVVLAP